MSLRKQQESDRDIFFEDKRGQWGKMLARDGYSPFTQPVVRTVAYKDQIACPRLVKNYFSVDQPRVKP